MPPKRNTHASSIFRDGVQQLLGSMLALLGSRGQAQKSAAGDLTSNRSAQQHDATSQDRQAVLGESMCFVCACSAGLACKAAAAVMSDQQLPSCTAANTRVQMQAEPDSKMPLGSTHM